MSSPTEFGITSVGLSDFERIGQYEGTNPVIVVGTDSRIGEIGNILYESTDTGKEYKLWYTSYVNYEKICYASSSDGHNWTKYASNPIISRKLEDPYIVKVGTTYYLYAEDKEEGTNSKIRRYHSDNLTAWTDDGDITGITDCQSPVVWKEGDTWYLIYEHYPTTPNDARLATSSDGLAWTNEASNPIFSAGDTWGTAIVVPDDITKIGDTYWFLYHGSVAGLTNEGIASSTDLLTWTDGDNNPLWSDESSAQRPVTVMFVNDGDEILYYYASETGGIYRGYPLKML